MPSLTHDAVIDAMRTVQEPELGRDIVNIEHGQERSRSTARPALTIELTTPACPLKDEIERNARAALSGIGATESRSPGARWSAARSRARPSSSCRASRTSSPSRPGKGRRRQEHGQRQPGRRASPSRRVRRAARRRHHRPEHPADDGPRGPAQGERQQQDHPARALRRQDDLDPVLRARGSADRVARPLVGGAIQQFLRDVDWGDLDYLVIDLPPGTSDAQLTLAQAVPISGAVLVTTPQEVSLADVGKALAMFQRMSVPVLGLVENMTAFACPHCGEADRDLRPRRRRAASPRRTAWSTSAASRSTSPFARAATSASRRWPSASRGRPRRP